VQQERNAMAIWQDPVTEQGFAQSYQSVKCFVNKLATTCGERSAYRTPYRTRREAQVTALIQWGEPQSGKYRAHAIVCHDAGLQ
jgi:hypothetical protein